MSDSDSDLDGTQELEDILKDYSVNGKEGQEEKSVSGSEDDTKTRMRRNMEVPMDKVIFGDKPGLIKKMAKAVEVVSEEDDSSEDDKETRGTIETESNQDKQNESTQNPEKILPKKSKRKPTKRKPVWTDADDEQIQLGDVKRETRRTGPLDHLRMDKTYKEYLTARFTRIVAQPKWANLDQKPKLEDSDDEELLQTVGFLAKPTVEALAPQRLHFKRLKDVNRTTCAEGSISSVCFHPSSTAALVAGSSGVATIYSIDGQKNEKLHSIGFQGYPIRLAQIAPCGTKAIFGSVHKYFYSYDLLRAQEMRHFLPKEVTTMKNFEISACGRYLAVAGRFGELHLFDAASKELINSFKQENPVAAIRFTADSRRIITNTTSCDVTIFSIRSQRLEHMFIDEGCITGAALDLAPSQRLLATGSREGVVNVYDFDAVLTEKEPQPVKRIMNLTTAISSVHFNHSSELLAMSSGEVASAVKLVHFPTGTVYSNFPGLGCELGRINTVRFSPASGYLAMGNRKKQAPLYRLKHFKNY